LNEFIPTKTAAARVAGVFFLLCAALSGRAQLVITADEQEQLDTAIGQRVEATAVFGTQSIASRTGLGWTLNGANGQIYKIPWQTELRDPAPVGDTGLLWAPVFEGGVGYASFVNDFNSNPLAGNDSDFHTVALSLGLGSRLYFGDTGFSVLPAVALLYAYTENNFYAHNSLGQQIVDDGRFVNWQVDTITLAPSFDFQYKKTFGSWTPAFNTDYGYFGTLPIYRSTDSLSFRSSSQVLANKGDLDYLTPWQLDGFPMHFGGDLSRTDLFQGLRVALGTDHYYQTDLRMTFDMVGRLWVVSSVGIDGGYFWCDAFTGYSIGVVGSLKF
jgi:Solitary outer membrane autotransporter beta-barrel domain